MTSELDSTLCLIIAVGNNNNNVLMTEAKKKVNLIEFLETAKYIFYIECYS